MKRVPAREVKTSARRPASPGLLVPVDGSASSLRALDHAMALAAVMGAKIHVLNVELPMDDYGMVGAYMTPRKHKHDTADRARALLAPALRRLEEAGMDHEAHVTWGEPAESIARTARRLKCGGVVMGTRGMGRTGLLLLGSTANAVVHLAGVPVTLVK
jgi:nucleotide-binding universal stress UspA family protein